MKKESLDALAEMIDTAGFGPATAVTMLPARGGEIVQVVLDAATPHKAASLLRWLDLITAHDAVAGKFRATDPVLRLNIRGQLPSGRFVVVAAPFHEQIEAQQVALINASIKEQELRTLVERLVAIENAQDAGRPASATRNDRD